MFEVTSCLYIVTLKKMKEKKEVFYPSLCSPICALLAFQQMEANKTIISNIRLGAAFVYRNDTELHAVFVYIYILI